ITVLHLAKNGVTGSTSTCPVILGLVISVKKEGSSERCLLQYHTIITSDKVKKLLVVVYFLHVTTISVEVYLTQGGVVARW
ncbi:hypothetical protein Z043_125009, partial [Scleropages formosus]